MQYASDVGGIAMVHEWKPVKAEVFAEAIHRYSVVRADQHGNGNLSQKSYKLDRDAVATVYYLAKEVGNPVSSPVLMSMRYTGDGKMIFFASLKYGDLTGPGGRPLVAERPGNVQPTASEPDSPPPPKPRR